MTIYSQIEANRRKTFLVMFAFMAVISALGFVIGKVSGSGLSWFGMALIVAGLSSFGSYFWSDQLTLAISGAKRISETDNPQLFHLVENLCIGAGLPIPKIYLINDSAPNAFATGRDPKHASIAVTRGLLEKLDKLELEGVLAHELSHIKNFDIRLMSIVVVMVGIIALVSDWFLRSVWWSGRSRDREERGGLGGILILVGVFLAVLSPLIAKLMQMTVSRRREFLADASGALLTRYPEGLAKALEKIASDREPLEVANAATAHLYIVNPLKNYSDKVATIFSTHPPVGERIKILRSM